VPEGVMALPKRWETGVVSLPFWIVVGKEDRRFV